MRDADGVGGGGVVQGAACPTCGAPTRALQEYCLECGSRLERTPGVRTTLASAWRGPSWYPGEWVWPVLALLVVALLVTPAVLAFGAQDEPEASVLVATGPETGPLLALESETAPTPTEPALPPQQTVPVRPRTSARPTGPIDWPENVESGWTVVIASLPASDGRRAAVDKAKEAIAAGLRDVGILDSAEFASLHPGYLVVFAGTYGTPAEAERAAERARAGGYDAAYIRQITV